MAGFKYERDEIYRFHLHGNEFSSREKETRLGKVALCNGNNRMIGDIGCTIYISFTIGHARSKKFSSPVIQNRFALSPRVSNLKSSRIFDPSPRVWVE